MSCLRTQHVTTSGNQTQDLSICSPMHSHKNIVLSLIFVDKKLTLLFLIVTCDCSSAALWKWDMASPGLFNLWKAKGHKTHFMGNRQQSWSVLLKPFSSILCVKLSLFSYMSRVMRKPTMCFLNRSDINQAL